MRPVAFLVPCAFLVTYLVKRSSDREYFSRSCNPPDGTPRQIELRASRKRAKRQQSGLFGLRPLHFAIPRAATRSLCLESVPSSTGHRFSKSASRWSPRFNRAWIRSCASGHVNAVSKEVMASRSRSADGNETGEYHLCGRDFFNSHGR
jgi:hypothetical protein